jgi:hypothetical protein
MSSKREEAFTREEKEELRVLGSGEVAGYQDGGEKIHVCTCTLDPEPPMTIALLAEETGAENSYMAPMSGHLHLHPIW